MTRMRHIVLTIALSFALGALAVSCIHYGNRTFRLSKTQAPGEIKRLVREQPEYFQHPSTLLILLDTTPCGGALAESKWWNDWQKLALENDVGFVVATSKADSNDIAIALRLQQLDAPILVLPACPDTVLGLGFERGYLPFKVLIDRTGEVRWYCACVIDTSWNNRFLHDIDSIGTAIAASEADTTH